MTKKPDEIALWNKIWDRLDKGEKFYDDFNFEDVVDELQIPDKRADYILEKWSGYGLVDYGVNIWYGWIAVEDGITRNSLDVKS